MKNFNQRVFAIVRRIPRGKVMNYGQTARLAGSPHAARAVGYALHQARAEDNGLCWQRKARSLRTKAKSTWPSAAGMPQRLRLNCFFNA